MFSQYILYQLEHVSRVDVVWDEYLPESLMTGIETGSKRGKSVCRRVEPSSAIPVSWLEFVCIDDNKAAMFSFLVVR